MAPFTIALSPDQFASAKQRVQQQSGITLLGDSGKVSHAGVELAYFYDGVSQLTITPVEKPFFLSEGFVREKVTGWFAAV